MVAAAYTAVRLSRAPRAFVVVADGAWTSALWIVVGSIFCIALAAGIAADEAEAKAQRDALVADIVETTAVVADAIDAVSLCRCALIEIVPDAPGVADDACISTGAP